MPLYVSDYPIEWTVQVLPYFISSLLYFIIFYSSFLQALGKDRNACDICPWCVYYSSRFLSSSACSVDL